jgi:hypothetical protein
MAVCPSCGDELSVHTLLQSVPAKGSRLPTRELRRCYSCRRLAWRAGGSADPWADGGVDPSYDHLFDWVPKPLPQPWIRVPTPDRAGLEAELRAEVSAGHPLFGKPVVAIARCGRCDDVLFSVEEDPVWFVRVHLTWRTAPEKPPWPWTERLATPLAAGMAEHVHDPA